MVDKYIDAEQLLEELMDEQKSVVNKGMETAQAMGYGMSVCINIAKKQPAADVAPVRHAHWIPKKGHSGRWDGWICSAPGCGEYSCCKGNFCMNCGAIMDEKEAGE